MRRKLSRRAFVHRAAAASALALAPLGRVTAQVLFSSYPFKLGVASGDPAPDGFVIWTRIAPEPLEPEPLESEPLEPDPDPLFDDPEPELDPPPLSSLVAVVPPGPVPPGVGVVAGLLVSAGRVDEVTLGSGVVVGVPGLVAGGVSIFPTPPPGATANATAASASAPTTVPPTTAVRCRRRARDRRGRRRSSVWAASAPAGAAARSALPSASSSGSKPRSSMDRLSLTADSPSRVAPPVRHGGGTSRPPQRASSMPAGARCIPARGFLVLACVGGTLGACSSYA